ncbi:MAG: hypothetical protein P8Z00_21635 [Anaerolineales bacterium]|jgi:hypothetical protein
MKWIWNIFGVLLIIIGIIWILQGINILPGSFMTGQILYAFLGIGLDIIGLALLIFTNRSRERRS